MLLSISWNTSQCIMLACCNDWKVFLMVKAVTYVLYLFLQLQQQHIESWERKTQNNKSSYTDSFESQKSTPNTSEYLSQHVKFSDFQTAILLSWFMNKQKVGQISPQIHTDSEVLLMATYWSPYFCNIQQSNFL